MARSAFSKVAWIARATTTVVGLAIMLALVLGVATTAFGANGDFFKVGKANVASAVSVLYKSGAGPALSLKVDRGAPLAVDSTTKVANLNADRIDNMEASSFASAVHQHTGEQITSGTVAADRIQDGPGSGLDADTLDGKEASDFQQANAAAGGDLSGSYPNPQIATDAVESDEVKNYSLHIIDITESASYGGVDPGVVPAGGCINPTVPGAYADQGDFVFVNPPHSLPSGLVASPLLANSTGPLTFRLCNMTSSAIDPPQGSWGLAVFNAN